MFVNNYYYLVLSVYQEKSIIYYKEFLWYKEHDIFVFASMREACSNSLVEALGCGLPAVVRNSSSNPEVLRDNGKTFNGLNDVISTVEDVVENLDDYCKKLSMPGIEEIANNYCQFLEILSLNIRNGDYISKKLSSF